MKRNCLLALGATALALTCPARAELITFDSLTDNGIGTAIPNGYAGLDWNQLYSLNVADYPNAWNYHGATGYPVVEQSAPNVAINYWGYGSEIYTKNGTYNLISGYFDAAIGDVTVTVLGYRGSTVAYSQTYNLTQSAETFITFNYENITDANFVLDAGNQIAMDNLTVELNPVAAPEPGQVVAGVLLAGLGLVARRLGKRKGNQQS